MAQRDGSAGRGHTQRRRILTSLAVLAGILGALAPAAAFTTRHQPASPVASPSVRHKRHHKSANRPSFAVSVRGNRLVNAQGQVLRLIGLNRSGSQYMCVLDRGIFDGPTDAESIAEMKAWHINAIRVPLNEDCWLGLNGLNPAYSGTAYQSAIEDYVAQLNAAGLYVILEVHWNASGSEQADGQHEMLDASHGYTLWRSIATAFKTHPAVVFDLYNEPHGLGNTTAEQWGCWERGCGEYAGMSGLVATVRSTGAHNVILLGGLSWAANDSDWLKYEPYDPLHQLAASFHVYYQHTLCTTESCWKQTLVPLAARVPLVNDEFGELQCGEPEAVTWLNQWMSFATNHGFSMLAWTWDAKPNECSQFLITNYLGSPTPYGAAVEAFYAEHSVR